MLDQLTSIFSTKGSHSPTPRRKGYRVLIALGILIVAGVVAWQVNATLWTTHSERVGKALVHRFLQNQALHSPVSSTGAPLKSATLASCSGAQSSDPVKGLLEIPRLGVVAPVEQGTGDAQLDVAVGHDPYSVWPGAAGNSVLEAHDVSYFVSLPKLSAGDTVRYVSPCTTYVFQVSAHTIVTQGSPVYNTPGPTMTLVTCWPTNALWYTPDRYLVTASQVSQSSTAAGGQHYLTASAPPNVAVPAALASQGVTLATYSLPMGSFALAGTPDPAWSQTTSPLLVEGSAVEAYIAGVRSLTESRLEWWKDIAPGVSPPKPLVGADNPGYLTSLNVTITVNGAQPSSVSLSNTVTVSGGSAPGRYVVTVGEKISGNTLTVSSWSMQPS